MDIPFEVYCLGGGALLCALAFMVLLFPRLSRVRRAVGDDTAEIGAGASESAAFPPVSVIVTADNDAWNLPVLLPQILGQDYPAPLEVIVVDNGDGGPSETVVASLQSDFPNLYLTYAPANSRNLSRRKLALTLGVKAARYDHLLFTGGNCRIDSPLWLRAMARHFAEGKEIVAGYSSPAPASPEDSRAENRTEAFSRVRGAIQWLAPAIGGHLWRADGNNLGYTRRLFYENKGFQRSLNLKYGDDDIFVSEIARPGNSAVELSAESMVTELVPDSARAFRQNKLHRDFTARYLRPGSRMAWSLMSWLWWGWLALSAATSVAALPSLLPLMAVAAVWIALWLIVGWQWRSAMAALGARPLFLTVVWFVTIHPFITLAYRIRGRRNRYNNFTWTTEK